MKDQIREFIIQMMLADHRMFTLDEIYEATITHFDTVFLFWPFRSIQKKKSLIREAIYEKSVYRFLASHTREYVFLPKFPARTRGNKFGLIELSFEYKSEFTAN